MIRARCPKCGTTYSAGGDHVCTMEPLPAVYDDEVTPAQLAELRRQVAPLGVETWPSTYRYRDPEKRREYQRDLMRKRRAEENANISGAGK